MIVAEALAVLAAADLASGLAHWWGDRYASLDSRVWRAMAFNHLHHHLEPRAFVAKGYWASCWDSWAVAVAVLSGTALFGALNWQIALFAALIANANQVHRWSHGLAPPRLVRWARTLRLLQTPRHHAQHHRGAHLSHYCVLTPLLNPLLDRLAFWRALERLLAVFRLHARDESADLLRLRSPA
jgi:ubiquitin-conjugating enzyme E2 variant